jgi:hypothetical protein
MRGFVRCADPAGEDSTHGAAAEAREEDEESATCRGSDHVLLSECSEQWPRTDSLM